MSDPESTDSAPDVPLTGSSAPRSNLTLPPDSVATERTRPDVSEVQPDGWPVRSTAIATGSRERKYQAVIRQSVLDAIHGHGKSSTSVEVCGVLVGNVYQDDFGPYLHVNSSIRGDRAKGHAAQVTFTAETWGAIQATMDQEHSDERIVGWYHTHPGFGIFLSGMDLFIQDHFFNLPWQVAFVYDPLGGDEGMFFWKEGKADRQPFLIEPDHLLLKSDHSNREAAPTLAEVEAAEIAEGVVPGMISGMISGMTSGGPVVNRNERMPDGERPPLFAPLPPPEAPVSTDNTWAGPAAARPRRSKMPLWVLGAAAFVVSFACTMWGMYSIRHEEIIIPKHVDHAATRPLDRTGK